MKKHMFELDFEEFMDVVEKNRQIKNQDKRILHYLDEKDSITLFIKSVDMWEYFTVLSKQMIFDFGLQYEVSEDKAIEDFKTSFLYDARPLKEKKEMVLSLQKELDAGEDMVEEAKDYEDFLTKRFDKWEKAIFSFVDSTLHDEVLKDINLAEKSLGDFIRRLFNAVNSTIFRRGLNSVIKATMKDGVHDSEKELEVDIGFDSEMNDQAKVFTDRQLEGFYIEGKRWKGLKGVAEDVQMEISKVVRDGIVNKTGLSDIKKQIKDRLDVTESRATAIARTETTRFTNSAKIMAYEKSGIVKSLVWDSFLDDRTSPVCKDLNKQVTPLGKTFVSEDGREFYQPPAHVNCRSVVRPILVDK